MARFTLTAAALLTAAARITQVTLVILIRVALLAAGSPAHAQPIEHNPAPCMDTEAFPLIEARASSAEAATAIRGLKVRFKAETDSGWYEVAFRPRSGALFQAALPKPLPEAARVLYVIESSAPEFQSPEHVVNVLMGAAPAPEAPRARSPMTFASSARRAIRASSRTVSAPTGSEQAVRGQARRSASLPLPARGRVWPRS